jgi:glycosyltransferase involved in cell wall biosynthesis
MKLIIQIPCYNEADTLAIALAALPRQIPGIDQVEFLIVDDGSTDRTVETAKACGVDHVIRHFTNLGLARAFMTGMQSALALGADIIVNTDADNQYNASDIPALVAPILEKRAEYVIGTRPIAEIEHFSPAKKLLQKFGSWMVRKVSRTVVEDAPSGFRAITRDAALRLNVFNTYTYTLETIIQAGSKNIPIVCVPIRVNEDLRPSRLVKSIPGYIRRSIFTMLRIAVVYRPFRFFMTIGIVLMALGALPGLRFLWHYWHGTGGGMIQSLILAAILILMGTIGMMIAFIADLLSVNRQLLEDLQYHQRCRQFGAEE